MDEDCRDLLEELLKRLQKVEENQAAINGAFQAFIAVLAAHRPAESDDST